LTIEQFNYRAGGVRARIVVKTEEQDVTETEA